MEYMNKKISWREIGRLRVFLNCDGRERFKKVGGPLPFT